MVSLVSLSLVAGSWTALISRGVYGSPTNPPGPLTHHSAGLGEDATVDSAVATLGHVRFLSPLLMLPVGERSGVLLGPVTPYAGYAASAAALEFRRILYQHMPAATTPTAIAALHPATAAKRERERDQHSLVLSSVFVAVLHSPTKERTQHRLLHAKSNKRTYEINFLDGIRFGLFALGSLDSRHRFRLLHCFTNVILMNRVVIVISLLMEDGHQESCLYLGLTTIEGKGRKGSSPYVGASRCHYRTSSPPGYWPGMVVDSLLQSGMLLIKSQCFLRMSSGKSPLICRLIRQALDTFSNRHPLDQNLLSDFCTRVNELKSSDLNLDVQRLSKIRSSVNSRQLAPVTYLDVLEHPLLTTGIFVVWAHQRLPLHNHPGMYGVLKVLNGLLHVQTYSRISGGSPSSNGDAPEKYQLEVVKHSSFVASPDSPPLLLTPKERNFHRLEAVGNEPVIFVDFLSPPYNHGERPGEEIRRCSYFKEDFAVEPRPSRGGENSNDHASPSSQGRFCPSGFSCWSTETSQKNEETEPIVKLIEIHSPSDFWTDTAPYEGPQFYFESVDDFKTGPVKSPS
ncbi:unnamed protein product [Cyprideis torosa]|uniref:Uncharacterized protein n=1 Tax=Cyprideis torosa TaxID=163714 RepID=A0A7R8W6K2_9CRUS|nr:unnamed protein product [Cyprideis torosa]CAG0886533.1 unnamed protein product [Cyprideis torosa]